MVVCGYLRSLRLVPSSRRMPPYRKESSAVNENGNSAGQGPQGKLHCLTIIQAQIRKDRKSSTSAQARTPAARVMPVFNACMAAL